MMVLNAVKTKYQKFGTYIGQNSWFTVWSDFVVKNWSKIKVQNLSKFGQNYFPNIGLKC